MTFSLYGIPIVVLSLLTAGWHYVRQSRANVTRKYFAMKALLAIDQGTTGSTCLVLDEIVASLAALSSSRSTNPHLDG